MTAGNPRTKLDPSNRKGGLRRLMLEAVCIAAVTAIAACGSGSGNGTQEENVDVMLDQLIAELTLQAEIICDCYELLDYESRKECLNAQYYPGPSQRRCIIDAYQDNEEAARQYLNCRLPLEQEYTSCVDARVRCDDLDALSEGRDACVEDFNLGAEQCIKLPADVDRRLDQCFPED